MEDLSNPEHIFSATLPVVAWPPQLVQYLRNKIYMVLSFKAFVIAMHKMSSERIA